MKTNMAWTAVVRTLVQGVIGMLLTSSIGQTIISWVEGLGMTVSVETITNAVTLFLIGLIVLLVNTFGPKFAWINQIISLGLSRTGPAYVPNDADAVVSKANSTADDTITKVDVPPPGPNERFDDGYNAGDPPR